MFGNSVGMLVFEIIKKIKPRWRGASVNACREVTLQLRLGNVGNLQCLFSCRLEIPTRITSSDSTSCFDLASAARPDWFRWLSVHVQCVITALDCFSNIRHHLQYCTFVFEGLDYGHSSLYSGK